MLQEAVGSVSSASRLGAVMVGSDHGGPGQLPTAKESFGRELSSIGSVTALVWQKLSDDPRWSNSHTFIPCG